MSDKIISISDKIIRIWLEYRDKDGEKFIEPASPQDIINSVPFAADGFWTEHKNTHGATYMTPTTLEYIDYGHFNYNDKLSCAVLDFLKAFNRMKNLWDEKKDEIIFLSSIRDY